MEKRKYGKKDSDGGFDQGKSDEPHHRILLCLCFWETLFQQFYSMVDTIIVGKLLGLNALAGVGSTGAISFMINGFVIGLCSGFAIPVAQKFGAKQESKTSEVCGKLALAQHYIFHCHDGFDCLGDRWDTPLYEYAGRNLLLCF